MIIMALDPSTVTTGVFVADDTCHPLLITTYHYRGPLSDRFAQVVQRLSSLIDQVGPDILAVEAPWMGRNPQTAIKLAHITGWLWGRSVESGIEFISVQPSEGKIALSGWSGSGSDEMVICARLVLSGQFGVVGQQLEEVDEHIAHALGIFEHVRGQVVVQRMREASGE